MDRPSFFDFGRRAAPDVDSANLPLDRPGRGAQSPQSPERRLIGPDGREWRVREAPMPSYDRRGGSCLIFETNDAARRVRNYPADWFDLGEPDLYGLSLRP